MKTAEQVAERFNGDGQQYEDWQGRSLDEVAQEYGADVQHGHLRWTRYIFKDGSAIVDCGTAWDIEGSTPWSWAGTE